MTQYRPRFPSPYVDGAATISLDYTHLSFAELIEIHDCNPMSAQDQPQDMSSLASRIINFGKFNVTSQVLSLTPAHASQHTIKG